MNKLIFIAIPTAGTVKDSKLTDEFLKFFANLHQDFPQHTFISPMVQDYQILPHLKNKDANWETWGDHCRTIIPKCDELWILPFPGWDTSKGVAGEVECAKQHNIPYYIHLLNHKSEVKHDS